MEEETGTEMIFEEQEINSETQRAILEDLGEKSLEHEKQGKIVEKGEEDLEAKENSAKKDETHLGEHDNTSDIEKVGTIEDSVEIANQKAGAESQVEKKATNPNVKWYILQAYSGYEGRVEQTIREKLKIKGIEHLVDEIFIPSEDIIRTKEGKKRKVNQKYFPGYVLIHMELTPELWHLLMEVNRVSGFIGGTPKNPLPLEEKELEEIRFQVNEGFQQKATEDEFTVGQKVTILEGSFGNFSGTIDEVNLERRKLKVLVSIFGRPTPVEVEFENVKHVLE